MVLSVNRTVVVRMMANVIPKLVSACVHLAGQEMCVPTNAPQAPTDQIVRKPVNALRVRHAITSQGNANVLPVIWESVVSMSVPAIRLV